MAGDVDDVIHPAHDPEIAIGISAGPVAGEINVFAVDRWNVLPVALAEAFVVAMDGAHHARPGPSHRQIAPLVDADAAAFQVDHIGGNARQGQGAGAWFGGGGPRQGADHHAAGLRLPPGVDDGAAVASNHIAVPHPGFGIDGLTHRAQQPQAR